MKQTEAHVDDDYLKVDNNEAFVTNRGTAFDSIGTDIKSNITHLLLCSVSPLQNTSPFPQFPVGM